MAGHPLRHVSERTSDVQGGILIPYVKVRLASLASRQFGQVTWAQLRAFDLAPATIRWWVESGYLVRVLPRVYAVGHLAPDQSAWLFSLILHAGPNASLSHGTAAHWRGWSRYPVAVTHLSTPRRIRKRLPGVRLHCGRQLEREVVNGIPCTSVTQTLLDLAATEPIKLVLRSLAQLDYERALDPAAIRAACGRGRPGSGALIEALESYIPQLARSAGHSSYGPMGSRLSVTRRTRSSTRPSRSPGTRSPSSSNAAGLGSDSNILHGVWTRLRSSTT